jgi:glyoxylase-like metal-dependent hydrolase (beta-lactamase superfamily II)
MAAIPLEDNFNDIIGKAQRGQKLDDQTAASRAGISTDELARVKGGEALEPAIRKLAKVLNLGEETLVASAKKAWHPNPIEVDGLAQFTTPYDDITVNSYLVWGPDTKEAIAFDTGADASPMLNFARERNLKIRNVLLTHIHPDHIADLTRLKKETGALAFVSSLEPTGGAEPFEVGRVFKVGGLTIETRQTSGHARGGITYFVKGLKRPVAVVGDAMFAGSMGGGLVSYAEALDTNRRNIFSLPEDTVLCSGHGPLTTVAEQKRHNPFFPEFQNK